MPKKGHDVNETFGWIDKISPLTCPVVIGKAMMEVMEAATHTKKCNKDVVCRGNVCVIGSISINMRRRVDKPDSMERHDVSEHVDEDAAWKDSFQQRKGKRAGIVKQTSMTHGRQ